VRGGAEPGVTRIGMITPSSNTCVEPLTYRILAGVEDVTVHFSRIPVTTITLDASAQFAAEPMLHAARLLGDARVDVLVWNGTSGSWLGAGHDEERVRLLREATGIPATTTTLAMAEAFAQLGVQRLGLVTPYTGDVVDRMAEQYAARGVTVVAERHSGLSDNDAFARIPGADLEELVCGAARNVDAVAVVCTNLAAAPLVSGLEAELGVPVLDSVAVTLWWALRMSGRDGPVEGWGALLAGRRR
jgi:maleate isomerase